MGALDLKQLARAVVVMSGAPLLTDCSGPPPCSANQVVAWDGGVIDSGTQELPVGVRSGGAGYYTCLQACPGAAKYCEFVDAGLLMCEGVCVGGRAPPGLKSLSAIDESPGSWLARMAELELAAVRAFEKLAEELAAHGYGRLSMFALSAALHEVRHAQLLTRTALGFGACPKPIEVANTPIRSLEAVAIDNAAEGCGRELLGAFLNAHQAEAASDSSVRRTMGEIAVDEQAHARFSLELAKALMPKLTVAQRRRVREAQEQTLVQMVSNPPPEETRRVLGLMGEPELQNLSRRFLEAARI